MSIFTVTTGTNNVQVGAERRNAVAFTVYNASGQEVRGRASLATVPGGAPHAAWLAIDGEVERAYAIGGAEQVGVNITVPADAAPGNYTFRLNMVATYNPDETLTEGPTVTVTVPEPEPAPQRKFPIWIIPLVLVVLAIIAVIVVIATRQRTVAVPDVVGLTEDDAGAELEGVRLAIGRIRDEHSSEPVDRVARTDPSAGTEVPRDARVDLYISIGTAVPTATPTPTPTRTPTVTPTPSATPTATPDATATADALIQQAIAKYTGTWKASDSSSNGLSTFTISNSGTTISVRALGRSYFIRSGNNVGALGCPVTIFQPDNECEWLTANVNYTGDPLVVTGTANGLEHVLTVSITPDGTTMSVLHQMKIGGAVRETANYTLNRQLRLRITPIFLPPDIREAPLAPIIPISP